VIIVFNSGRFFLVEIQCKKDHNVLKKNNAKKTGVTTVTTDLCKSELGKLSIRDRVNSA
jgi:hypothetical protein